MVTMEQIEKGLAAYLDNELMPLLPNSSLEKVLAGTAISLGIRSYGKIAASYKDNKIVQTLGIMDSDGLVDIDVLAEEVKKNIPPEGVVINIPMLGEIKFGKDDVTKLRRYINE